MELTYSELKKRDVVNIVDGKCLGRINDIKFRFPEGVIVGIIVPGKRSCFLAGLFSKSSLYIPEKNIVKIGGDVILVDLSCGTQCADYVNLGKGDSSGRKDCKDKKSKPSSCPPPHPPTCPPPHPPVCTPPCSNPCECDEGEGLGINFDEY